MIKNIIKIIFSILVILALLIFILLIILKYLGEKPIETNYFTKVNTDEILENKYTNFGEYKVNTIEFESNEELFTKYKIWYPSQLKQNDDKYPIVLFVNGTGVPYTKYSATFEHLASWGFVVIGNDDPNTGSGKSTSITLDFIVSLNNNKESIFYNKLDVHNIGVSGHSQGGVGAINAVTEFENSNSFKSIYTASTTSHSMIDSWNLKGWNYDTSKVNIPYFMVAGTGKTDANTITPLDSLIKNYESLSDKVPVVMARRKDVDHGDMLIYADGYMTAWFRYTLMNDKTAGNIFSGDSPEILNNLNNWQDIRIKNLDYKIKSSTH